MDRRRFVAALGALPLTLGATSGAGAASRLVQSNSTAAGRPRPTRAQLEWQRDELAMFVHFGVNTFTDREWGDGTEDPRIFAPAALDAGQWARTAKAAGFRAMILTAKHHDGFCLWPTKTTRHSVAASPWRDGRGDLVREFVDACRAEGLKAGLYLSPWDRHEPRYGDSPAYNDFYIAQLTELLTQYGAISEVWFDGANGEGPNGKRQEYDWPRTWATVRRLQPGAVMFSDAGPDVRWIGNERGAAGTTNWSTVDPRIVTVPGMSGDDVMRSLQDGDRDGTVWRPGETDVSIRPGWFHHPAEDDQVRGADDLVQLYFTSVGRNSKLLLNVPPGRDGLLQPADATNLRAMRERLDALFARNLVATGTAKFTPRGPRTAVAEVTLRPDANVGIIDLREDIAQGQRVASYRVEVSSGATWREVASGTTIGHRKLERVSVGTIRRLRVMIEDAVEAPLPLRIACYATG
ncbi:MAG: alpha-L-fucosidase [Gemmatimonadaceae bacterium]|nr:alpha-L-fucosidase [Gemmatimonadaceae bacterium]